MRVEREVVGLEFGGLVVEQAVEQDGAEDGALGVDAGGESAFQTVVGGRHRFSLIQFRSPVADGWQCRIRFGGKSLDADFVRKAVYLCGERVPAMIYPAATPTPAASAARRRSASVVARGKPNRIATPKYAAS